MHGCFGAARCVEPLIVGSHAVSGASSFAFQVRLLFLIKGFVHGS